MIRFLRATTTALLLGSLVSAHDFWIEPESFAPTPGTLLKVRLRVGDLGVGDNVARDESRILRLEFVTPKETKKLVGRDGQEFAGLLRVESNTPGILAYQSNHAYVELEPEKFAKYLREKGLDAIAKLREQRGETALEATEIYSRCAKALLDVGDPVDARFDQMLDLPLELTPEKNPTQLVPGTASSQSDLPLRLWYRGEPLANATVAALCLDEPHAEGAGTLIVRTDKDGRVSFRLPRRGRWLIASVHMIAASENARGAHWESFWASLTFEIKPVRAGTEPVR